MDGDAVHRRRHAMLAHPPMDIAAGIVAGPDFLQILGARVVRRRQIGRAADQLGDDPGQRVEHRPRGLAGRDLGIGLAELVADLGERLVDSGRQLAALAALELAPFVLGEGPQPPLPRLAHFGAARPRRAPSRQHVVGDDKRRIFPAEPLARGGDLGGPERAAMRCRGAGLGRRAKRDHGAAGDQARPVAVVRALDRRGDRVGVVAVDALGVPAMRAKAHDLVVGDREAGRPVDRDRVVVVEHDQFVEA